MTGLSRAVRTLTLIAVLTASLAATLGVAAAAGQPPTPPIKLLPSDPHGNQLPGLSYFRDTGRPGTTLYLHVLVGDSGSTAATVLLRPVDAQNAVYGGVSYNLPSQSRQNVGAWIHLSRDHVHLGPGQTTVVSFQVHIPAAAKSGQYVGGLTAYVPATSPKHSKFGGLVLQLRTVAAVVVTTPGHKFGQFRIHNLVASYDPSGVYADIVMKNTGNLLIKGQGHVTVTKVGATTPVIDRSFPVDTTVPGSGLRYPIPWNPKPSYGLYAAHVTLHWWDGSTTWSRTFRVGPPPPRPHRPGQPTVSTAGVSSSPSSTIVGLSLGLAAFAGLGLVVWLLWRRRRGDDEGTDVQAPVAP